MAKAKKVNEQVSAARKAKHGGIVSVFFALLSIACLTHLRCGCVGRTRERGGER